MGGASALLALLAVVVWWKPWQHRDGSATTVPPLAAADTAPAAASPESGSLADAAATNLPQPPLPTAAVRESARAIPTLARTSPESAANPAAPPPAVDANQPGAGRARLRLSFSADSWVDVRDAQGNKAYVGNGSANTVKSISGQAPMHVYLRSGSGVQLEINGRAVAIGPQFFAGDVARFEAGADGVLRREARRDPAPSSASTRPPG
jgi:cytoskeleton protein RodZ